MSELSDLMDFSLDESEDFMTLGSFDPLTSTSQPTPVTDEDLSLSFFAEPSPESAEPPRTSPVPTQTNTPTAAAGSAQAAGFTLPLQQPVNDIYAALRQPSPMTVKSPEEEHYEKLTLMKINEMVNKKSPSPVETTPTSEPVLEGALQDPFSLEALTKELEEKRAKHAEEQATRQALLRKRHLAAAEEMQQLKAEQAQEAQAEAAQAEQQERQEKKLFRRNSHMVKGQVRVLLQCRYWSRFSQDAQQICSFP